MLTEQPHPRCMCDECGNTWTARKIDVSNRRCPKCGSRTTSVAKGAEKGNVPLTKVEETSIEGDPEIVKAKKELRLAELQAQKTKVLSEIRSPATKAKDGIEVDMGDKDLIKNLATQFKMFAMVMKDGDADRDFFELLEGWCPFCNEVTMEHVELRPGMWGWRCVDCGNEV